MKSIRNRFGALLVVAGAMQSVALAGDPGFVVGGYISGNSSIGKCTKVVGNSTHFVAIQESGQVVVWGGVGGSEYGESTIPTNLGACKGIAANGQYGGSAGPFTLALKVDGTVVAWGYNGAGQCNVPTDLGPCIQIAAGFKNSLALKANGSLAAWGQGEWGFNSVPSGTFITIAAGIYHGLAISENGIVYQWGQQSPGPQTALGPCKAIAGGSDYSVALKNDGTVVKWGATPSLIVPVGIGACKAISAGPWGGFAALREDGIPVSVGGSNGLRVWSELGPCTEIDCGWAEDFIAIQAPPSSITGVLPISGPTTGGTAITISGTKFQNPPIVKIGGVLATDVVWVSSNTVTAVTPIGTPGMTTVSVNEISVEGFYYRPTCGADLDNNNVVDSADLGYLLLEFGNCSSESAAATEPVEPVQIPIIEQPKPLAVKK